MLGYWALTLQGSDIARPAPRRRIVEGGGSVIGSVIGSVLGGGGGIRR